MNKFYFYGFLEQKKEKKPKIKRGEIFSIVLFF